MAESTKTKKKEIDIKELLDSIKKYDDASHALELEFKNKTGFDTKKYDDNIRALELECKNKMELDTNKIKDIFGKAFSNLKENDYVFYNDDSDKDIILWKKIKIIIFDKANKFIIFEDSYSIKYDFLGLCEDNIPNCQCFIPIINDITPQLISYLVPDHRHYFIQTSNSETFEKCK